MLDPFGRTRSALPKTLHREGRVELLAQLADDLVAGRAPDRVAAVWLGAALAAWLTSSKPSKDADLVRDYLELAAGPRSTATPQRIWARLCRQTAIEREARDDDASETSSDAPTP